MRSARTEPTPPTAEDRPAPPARPAAPSGRTPLPLRVLLAQATTGSTAVVGALAVVLVLLLTTQVDVALFDTRTDAANLLLTATAFLAPLGAGASALRAGSRGRGGTAALAATSPRGRGGAMLLSWAAVSLWQVAAYAVGLGVVLARITPTGSSSPSAALLVVQALLVLLVAAAAGEVVGTAFTSYLAPPLVAVACFASLYFTSYASGAVVKASLIYPATFYTPFLQPNRLLVGGQVAVLAGVLTVALVVWSNRGPQLIGGGAVAVVVAMLGVGAIVTAEPQSVQYRTRPSSPPCSTEQGTTLCVWPDYAPAAPQALDALVRARQAAPWFPTPGEYAMPGLRPAVAGTTSPAPLFLGSTAAAPSGMLDDTLNDAATAVTPTPCAVGAANGAASAGTSPEDAGQAWAEVRDLVATATGALDYPPDETVAVLASDRGTQQAWVDVRLDVVQRCVAVYGEATITGVAE